MKIPTKLKNGEVDLLYIFLYLMMDSVDKKRSKMRSKYFNLALLVTK